jgi:hypothetical protein
MGSRDGRSVVQSQPGQKKSVRPYLKKRKEKQTLVSWGASVIQVLLEMEVEG